MKIRFMNFAWVITMSLLAASVAFADGLQTQLSAEQVAIKTAAIYPTVNVRPLITAADGLRGVIFFTTAAQREQRRIIITGGYVYDHTGVPFTYTNQNNGEMNYVMDSAGNFYWLDESTDPTIRHDTIFDKGPVAGGGNITIVASKLICIDSDSGHYPTGPIFPNVVTELTHDDNDMSQIKAVDTDNSGPFHKPSKTGTD